MAENTKFMCHPRGLPAKPAERFELSDLDHLVRNALIPLLAIYELPNDSQTARQAVVATLKSGLEKVGAQFPIQCGRVYEDTETKTRHVSRDSDHNGIWMYVKGEEKPANDLPSFSALERANFPTSALPLTDVLPLDAFKVSWESDRNQPSAPACVVQVNFVEGGVIVAYAFNHSVADMPSTDMFLEAWAANSKLGDWRGHVSLDRSMLSAKPSGLPAQTITEIEERLISRGKIAINSTVPRQNPPQPRKCTSAILGLSKSACQELKAQVSSHLDAGEWVSTADCVSALIWRAVIRAKLAAGHQDEETPTTSMYLSVGTRKNGSNISSSLFANAPLLSRVGPIEPDVLLHPGSLASLARMIRTNIEAVDQQTIDDFIIWAGAVARPQGRGQAMRGLDALEIGFNSWANVRGYQTYDFGFGLPSTIRQAELGVEWINTYPMRTPRNGKEEVFEVQVGQEIKVHDILQKDAELGKYLLTYNLGLDRI